MDSVSDAVEKVTYRVRDHIFWASGIGVLLIIILVMWARRRKPTDDETKVARTMTMERLSTDKKGETDDNKKTDELQSRANVKWKDTKDAIKTFSSKFEEAMKAVAVIYTTLNLITSQENVIQSKMGVKDSGTNWKSMRESISGASKIKAKYDKQISKWMEKLHNIPHDSNMTFKQQIKTIKECDELRTQVCLEMATISSSAQQLKDVGDILLKASEDNRTLVEAAMTYNKK